MAKVNKLVTGILLTLCFLLGVVYCIERVPEPKKQQQQVNTTITKENHTGAVCVNPVVLQEDNRHGIQQKPITIK